MITLFMEVFFYVHLHIIYTVVFIIIFHCSILLLNDDETGIGQLDVSYAPQFESTAESRHKIIERSDIINQKLKERNEKKGEDDEDVGVIERSHFTIPLLNSSLGKLDAIDTGNLLYSIFYILYSILHSIFYIILPK